MNNDEAAAEFHVQIAQDAVSCAADYAEHICAPRCDQFGDVRSQSLAHFFRWLRCAEINLALAEFAMLPARPARRTLKSLALRRKAPRA